MRLVFDDGLLDPDHDKYVHTTQLPVPIRNTDPDTGKFKAVKKIFSFPKIIFKICTVRVHRALVNQKFKRYIFPYGIKLKYQYCLKFFRQS